MGALAVLGFSVINSGHERAGTTTTGPTKPGPDRVRPRRSRTRSPQPWPSALSSTE
ncbi:hypothetical protein BZL29_7506 [Mycobacterium kansasii]|uniref:Uncharacterized protein n=1 Tax=Mycobacterium kansasii TaxID=1768 RepID=A0A1V3WIY0_MYCKA|nr:hypothetical protein BZL29_7506 [Mycobacterium kansasii]